MARRRWSAGRIGILVVGLVAALGLTGWLFGGSYLRQREAALSRAQEAAILGGPCPTLTLAEFQARRLKAPKATLYEGVTFARQFGHMDCRALRYGGGWGTRTYPVCQFTSPNALHITTAKGEWWFAPGPGQPATVGAPNGEARCVMASNFTLERLIDR